MEPEDSYQSVLASRYCNRGPLVKLFSERNKTVLWRQLWIWLAESEMELGLKQISQEAIDEMKAKRDEIDWKTVRAEEKRLKHDVMAHNHAFGKICPKAAGIIHLGATSCFVQDNADLIVQRDGIDYLLKRLARVLSRLAAFAETHKELVTVGRTHYQTASLVTVGKRATIWAQELLMAFKQLVNVRENLRFRGIKGATGTQDSFMTLFMDDEKVEKLDDLVTTKAGFTKRFYITGQTYSRQQDAHLLFALSCIGAAAEKICKDIRILQVFNEIMEPFEQDQIGSSAMPYKRNPMKSERCCSFARGLIHSVEESLQTLADQGFERTLDDSAGRRMLIPDSMLTTEALLITLQNIVEGLRVQKHTIERVVAKELPFLAFEKTMMWLTEHGVDRQEAHEKIRVTALSAKERQEEEGHLFDPKKMLDDPFFDKVRVRYIALLTNPSAFVGRCSSQVSRFIKEELQPAIASYLDKNDENVQLDV